MKKVIILFAAFLFAGVLSVRAQSEKFLQSGGLRAGFHSASMVIEGSKPDTAYSINSFYVGIFRESKVSKIIYFGSGLEYFQNGLKYSGESKRVLHTLSVPFDLKLKLGPAFALGGIAANFKVGEKVIIGDNSYMPSDENKTNWFDLPVFVGAGLKISFISIEARYHMGLFETRNGLYNRYFQLGIALSH